MVRLQPDPLAAIDRWVRKQKDQPTRAEAIHRLVDLGLKVKTPAKTAAEPGPRTPARTLPPKRSIPPRLARIG